ncbi:MAG: hypothetical protein COB60_08720 [Flavobacteriaceae bacterium]|nr:MAG: hypothetical protein COB60_08720 [Flavobacteriaceae bacterium]
MGLHMHFNNDSVQWSIEEVLIIENQKIQEIGSSISFETKDPKSYFTIGNTIFTKANDDYQLFKQFKIKKYNNDSLVLTNDVNTKTFRKLSDSLKTNKTSTIDLKNKQFEVKFEGSIDTLYFEKDFYIRKSNQSDRKWETPYWEIKEVNGFYFLFTGDSFLFLIQRKNEKLYLFKLLKDRINEIELNEINVKSTEINSVIEHVKELRKNNEW